MADLALQRNLGAYFTPKALSNPVVWTAAGTGDTTLNTGISVDRGAFSNGALPFGVDADVIYSATLASGATLTLLLDLQTSADNTNWSDYASQAATVVATGPSGGGKVTGVARLTVSSGGSSNMAGNNPDKSPGVDLSTAKRYVRLNVTPDLSATGTDTGVLVAVGYFGGFDSLPAAIS